MQKRLLTHGTVGGKLILQSNINLTGTQRLDKKHNRYKMFSLNPSKNQFVFAQAYCDTNKTTLSRLMSRDKKRFSMDYKQVNPLLVAVIQVWVWDYRFDLLLINNQLTSRLYSTAYCERMGINFVDYNDDSLWGKIDLDNHFELTIRDESLLPYPDLIILGRDIKNYTNDFRQIRNLFNIPQKTCIVIADTLLVSKCKRDLKYKKNKQTLSDKRLKRVCLLCLDNNIKEYIMEKRIVCQE